MKTTPAATLLALMLAMTGCETLGESQAHGDPPPTATLKTETLARPLNPNDYILRPINVVKDELESKGYIVRVEQTRFGHPNGIAWVEQSKRDLQRVTLITTKCSPAEECSKSEPLRTNYIGDTELATRALADQNYFYHVVRPGEDVGVDTRCLGKGDKGAVVDVRLFRETEVVLVVWPDRLLGAPDIAHSWPLIDISNYIGRTVRQARNLLKAHGAGPLKVRLTGFTNRRCCDNSDWRPTDIVRKVAPDALTEHGLTEGLLPQGATLFLHVAVSPPPDSPHLECKRAERLHAVAESRQPAPGTSIADALGRETSYVVTQRTARRAVAFLIPPDGTATTRVHLRKWYDGWLAHDYVTCRK